MVDRTVRLSGGLYSTRLPLHLATIVFLLPSFEVCRPKDVAICARRSSVAEKQRITTNCTLQPLEWPARDAGETSADAAITKHKRTARQPNQTNERNNNPRESVRP
ncbi:hypothetical protein BD310DRAFT_923661, partial [Dichomitus squalens]